MNSIAKLLVITLASATLFGCGDELQQLAGLLQGSGTSGKSRSADAEPIDVEGIRRVQGTIVSQFGSNTELQGWNMVMTPDNMSSARLSAVDGQGNYEFSHVSATRDQTLTMLSPDFIVSAVLSMPADIEGVVWQYFRPMRTIPEAALNGRVILIPEMPVPNKKSGLAADTNGDGVPEGAEILLLAETAPLIDQDLDGVPNTRDPDIDGDGVANVFDDDDNGNGLVDLFDGDSNGNLINDGGEQISDHHFDDGWVGVTLTHTPDGDELKIAFRLYGNAPQAVVVQGAAALLHGAHTTGNVAWNRMLLDDGMSGDGGANDGLFSAQIKLAAGKMPRAREVLFVDLVYPDHVKSLPHMFSSVLPQAFSGAFEAATRKVMLRGNPYGVIQDFYWVAEAICDGQLSWISPVTPGVARTLLIPRYVLNDDRTCQLQLNAFAMSPMAGFPWIMNKSAPFTAK